MLTFFSLMPHVLGTLICNNPGTLTCHVFGDMRDEGTVDLTSESIGIMSLLFYFCSVFT